MIHFNKSFTRLLFFFFLICCTALRSDGQSWLVAKQISCEHSISTEDIAVDSDGNVYVTGYFTGTAYVDNDTIACHTDGDYFIAKYNSVGTALWVKTGAGHSSTNGEQTYITGIAIGESRSFYVAGSFCGSILFDTISLSVYGQNDIFIAKFDSSGNCIWVKQAGGSGIDGVADVEIDESNSLYITGTINNYFRNVFFDSDTIPMSNTQNRFFIAKYDSAGNFKWVKTSIGPGRNSGSHISCYKSNLYVTGFYDSLSVFDTVNFISSGFDDFFILQYDSSGSVNWGRTAAEPLTGEGCLGVSHDSVGNCYAVGYFGDTITFDTTKLSCTGISDCFIAKYSINGALQWVKQLHASDLAFGYSIQTDDQGNSFVTGEFRGSAAFDSVTIVSAPYRDMFVAKYNNIGDCIGIRHVRNSFGRSITTDANGISYVTGGFIDTAIFDSFTLYADSFVGNIFWAKLDALNGVEEEGRFNNSLLIYANPNRGICSINVPREFNHEKNLVLSIYDNTGKVIQEGSLDMREDKVRINISAEAKGIYNVILSNGKKSYSGKIVFE